MTVHEVVQNIIEEYDLAQKQIESVRNERPKDHPVEASNEREELWLIDTLTDGQRRIDRERDRLDRLDPKYKHTDGIRIPFPR